MALVSSGFSTGTELEQIELRREVNSMLLVIGGGLAIILLAVAGVMLWGAFANLFHVVGQIWHFVKNIIAG